MKSAEMTSRSTLFQSWAEIPRPFFLGLVLSGGFLAFTAWDQSHWWRQKDDYAFGWLVPIFVAYVTFDRWPRIARSLQLAGQPGEFPDLTRDWLAPLYRLAAFLAVLGGSSLLLVGAAYRAAAGPSYNGTFAISLGTGALVLAAIYFLTPTDSAAPASRRDRERARMAGYFFFPAMVWLVSAPMLAVVENNLNGFLMRQVTTVVFSLFDHLGLPLEQRGNILVLPSGSVGVEEACSGIRSLTGCLYAGSAVAAVFLTQVWAKVGVLVASLLFAVLANLLRSIFLTAWAYRYGAKSIEGTIHDVSGYCILGLTIVALFCITPLLSPARGKVRPPKGRTNTIG